MRYALLSGMPWAMSWCAVVPGARRRRTGGVGIGMAPCGRGSSSRASVYLLAFAVAAIGELVAKPARAAGVAVGVRRLGRRRRGALLRALTVVPGGLRLHGRLHGRGDLLVERPGMGLPLRLGLLQGALGLLLAGGEVGFAAVQDR